MLRYLVNKADIEQIQIICLKLNELKCRIWTGDYSNPFNEYISCEMLFDEIKKNAIGKADEQLANFQVVFRNYFLVFCNLSCYFGMLKNKEYKNSWNKLQDCIDAVKSVGKYVEADMRLDIPEIYDLLEDYESLYPYRIFASTEYVISKSHCSICGKSMQNLDCTHIKGHLYWGEVAIEVIDEISEVHAISLVDHPENKRCVMEVSNDDREELEKFERLDKFLELQRPLFQKFSIETKMETRLRDDIVKLEPNKPCSCGSGIKFKKCCGRDMYYKHERNIITLERMVEISYI